MSHSRKLSLISFLLLLISTFPQFFFSSQVFHYPRSTDKLNERWSWAIQEARKQGFKDGFWIGYSINRLMGEYSYIYSTSKHTISGYIHLPTYLRGKTLGEIIYGKDFSIILSDEEQVQVAAKRALAEIEYKDELQRKVGKDVAVLFKFDSGSSKTPGTLRLNSITMPFDPEGLPIFWLDKAEDEESIIFLSNLYRGSIPEKMKKKLLSAIGFHGSSEFVVPFLEKVLKGNESDSLRGRAASELEDHDTEQALKILHQTAKNDRSYDVRKKAVYALEDMDLPGATDALIDIARNSHNMNIRKKAIYCLGDTGDPRALKALIDILQKK